MSGKSTFKENLKTSRVENFIHFIFFLYWTNTSFAVKKCELPQGFLQKLMFDEPLNTLEHFNTDAKLKTRVENLLHFKGV